MISPQDSELLLAIQRAPDTGWAPALHALAVMTYATRAALYLPAQSWSLDGPMAAHLPEVLTGLRPSRVYTGEELAARSVALGGFTGSDCRAIGFRPSGKAWLVLERDKGSFRAADSALLSTLAPHIEAALDQASATEELARQHAATHAILRKLAVGRVTYAPHAAPRPDPVAQHLLGRLGYLPPAPAHGESPQIMQVAPWLEMLWQLGPDGSGTAILRATDTPLPAPELVAQAMGLGLAEARLVRQLGAGASLQDAARQLGWTYETARAYSKQIFAKTGARGQPDLMRRLWAGVISLG